MRNLTSPRDILRFIRTLILCLMGVVSAPSLSCAPRGEAPAAEAPSQTHADHESAQPAPPPAPADANAPEAPTASEEEIAAYAKARPVLEAHCARCHKTGGAKAAKSTLNHFSMDSYPFGGHHADEITAEIRKVLGATGLPPTMPPDNPGVVKGDDLAIILAWADAYDRAHPEGGGGPEHDRGRHKH